MLQCAWEGSRPVLRMVHFPPGDDIPRQAAANAAKDPERDLLGSFARVVSITLLIRILVLMPLFWGKSEAAIVLFIS